MKKIITMMVLLVLLVLPLSVSAQFEEPEGTINTNPVNPKFSLAEFLHNFFQLKTFALLPSGYTCSSTISLSKTFKATTTSNYMGGSCGNTAKVKVYKCNSRL